MIMATALTSGELEALALQCRDAGFREGLASAELLWQQVQVTLQDGLSALDANITRSGTGTSSSEAQHDSGVEDEDDGLSYSFEVKKDASLDELSASSTTIHVHNTSAAMERVEQITSALRFLRNACAASPLNQDACREHQLLKLAHDIVMRGCIWSDVEDDALQQAVVLQSQVALQFSVNAITGRIASQNAVWELYFPDDFQKLLVECHEHRKIVAFTAALILNCVNTPCNGDMNQRRTDLVCARNLIITLLQRCLTRPTNSYERQAPVDDHDPAFEWICLLFRVLFESGFSKELYNAVGAHLLSRLWSRVTPEQLILLRMFTMWITSRRSKPRTPDDKQTDTPVDLVVEDAEERFIIFEFIKNTWVYITSLEEEDRPEEADATRRVMWMEFENEAKLLLLDVMGELTLAPSSSQVAEEALRSLLSELQRVWALRPLGGLAGKSPSSSQDAGKEPFGYRSAIIRVVGNMCHRQESHQNLVREEGYLPLFLNHCNIDEPNPLLREWSLVALRNLCEGNEANQAYITALRPQGLDSSNVNLSNVNVEASLSDDGKVRVTQKPGPSTQ
ncbi:hypothetical protein Poli38472_003956 [Pythium oligandrum]|uniref:Ataxin-10 domain-containing protein n=1 Tax=Pythium oligandrum TaxID=41045 RepID=A0A8K1CP50_PYTOL|nr:hypothetical protein Poli38472_003956 [Pythium oligandrum]|eukprot:TMW66191.1 hypothetical protein Poli38472_003956 [Pythium oligandrum]